ncbi:MAG TPA: SpoIVB peptidase S55 domain-containing protein [Candidatus Hypogeohydataceae bacterium YC38]
MSYKSIFPIFLLLLVVPLVLGAQDPAGIVLDLDELKPGMKGYGKTVFSGEKIEEFDVEILGVLKNWEAKTDMILVKMSGEPLDKTGIISGMSGSPVYIGDRVIGAVSYGWSFAKEAIAGVTPIKNMLQVLELRDDKEKKQLGASAESWESSLALQESSVKEVLEKRGLDEYPLRLVPIITPLVVSGFDQRVLKDMSSTLQKFGLFPVQGGGEALSSSDNVELLPGSAVATVLAKGDLNAAAVGTITYREGDTILAFGHPFIQSGRTDIPMAGAHVYTVIPSQSTSLKIAAPTRILGKISQDRKSALAGTLGEFSKMIPCRVKVKGIRGTEYNFEVVNNKFLTQNLIQWASESALLATERQAGDKTVRLSLSLDIEGRERPVRIENVYYEPHPTWFPVYHITQPISLIMNNHFMEVNITGVTLEAEVSDERKVAIIENIRVDKRQLKPGETLHVTATIKPFAQEAVEKVVPIQIPNDVESGSIITLNVCDSNTSQALERTRAPDKFNPSSFEHLVKIFEKMEPSTNLIIRALLPKRGITYKGQELPSLPPSLLAVMSSSNQSGVNPLMEEIVHREPVEWILDGSHTLSITVIDENHRNY